MQDRRGGRQSHVRPRSPSTGRPAPAKARTRTPPSGRVNHRRVEPPNRRRLPGLPRALLLVAAAAVAIGVFLTAGGGFARVVAGLRATVDDAIGGLSATPTPGASVAVVADAPLITVPEEPYTNQPAVDLILTVPGDVVGDPETVVRLYVARADGARTPVVDVPVGPTATVVIPDVTLAAGGNDFTATLVGPAGESAPSPVISYVLDAEPPGIRVYEPTEGQTINRAEATVTGKTQGRSTVVARNEASGESVTVEAGSDGRFELVLPLIEGPNAIRVTSTDPAGNVGELVIGVVGGTGVLTAELSAEPAELGIDDLPTPLELSVEVMDPDGRPLPDADVTFTLSVTSIQVVTADAKTGADGRAVFSTTVPAGATAGEGNATVLVRTAEFGEATDRIEIAVEE